MTQPDDIMGGHLRRILLLSDSAQADELADRAFEQQRPEAWDALTPLHCLPPWERER